jgi:hypothetical protein
VIGNEKKNRHIGFEGLGTNEGELKKVLCEQVAHCLSHSL